jgi:hypothetical protein
MKHAAIDLDFSESVTATAATDLGAKRPTAKVEISHTRMGQLRRG